MIMAKNSDSSLIIHSILLLNNSKISDIQTSVFINLIFSVLREPFFNFPISIFLQLFLTCIYSINY